MGLAAAVDAGTHGLPVVVVDDNNTVSVGSRALCYSKRALEILDRLGCGQRIVDKGITWNVGRVFLRDQRVYSFNLQPEPGHRRPAFVNLQQYYLEQYLVEQAQMSKGVDLRWQHRVVGVEPHADEVLVTLDTADGRYQLSCEYLLVADGANSTVRDLLGLESSGQVFHDRFLIADVHMKMDFPTERWFWFDPPFHPGQSTLLHRQAEDIWRIDFQLGWDADPEQEKLPERIVPRIKAMLGQEADFELQWASVYTFQCRRMQRFRHGRVLFAGDAAHQVSPFGARGANSGFQDTDNLLWKLKLVMDRRAPPTLLDSYDRERIPAADENILNSTRSTDFITPKNACSRAFRDATLLLSRHCPFARALVNSGRLSLPYVYRDSPLNTPDRDSFNSLMAPGSPCADAPLRTEGGDDWLLAQLGTHFCGLYFARGDEPQGPLMEQVQELLDDQVPVFTTMIRGSADSTDDSGSNTVLDISGLIRARYDALPGTFYLIRPDQHVAGRWRRFDLGRVRAAVARACGC